MELLKSNFFSNAHSTLEKAEQSNSFQTNFYVRNPGSEHVARNLSRSNQTKLTFMAFHQSRIHKKNCGNELELSLQSKSSQRVQLKKAYCYTVEGFGPMSFLHEHYIRTNLIIDGKVQKYSFSIPFVSCAQHDTLLPAPKQEQHIQQLKGIKKGELQQQDQTKKYHLLLRKQWLKLTSPDKHCIT